MISSTSTPVPAPATAVARAIRNHAETSSTAAADSARIPIGRCEHPPLGDDPGQHRERGDRHRDAHEQRERDELLVRAEQLVERQGTRHPEHHRNREAGVRHRQRRPQPPAKLAEVDLEPDQEHVEDQPEVGGDSDERDDVAGEDLRLQAWVDRAEHSRPEDDPGQHLPHHPRLAESRHHAATQPREQHHDEQRDEERDDGLIRRAAEGRRHVLRGGRGAQRRGRRDGAGWDEHHVERASGGGAGDRAGAAVRARHPSLRTPRRGNG